ncbi:MAG TPA: hypothetical protein VGF14_06300 [Alphaproteobacteria bacterium]
MFAYNTEKEAFFAATNASLSITYQDLRLRHDETFDDQNMKVLGAILCTRSKGKNQPSKKHIFDAKLAYVETINQVTQEPASSHSGRKLFRETLVETVARNQKETKPYKRLNAEETFILNKITKAFTAKNPVPKKRLRREPEYA